LVEGSYGLEGGAVGAYVRQTWLLDMLHMAKQVDNLGWWRLMR
jgi:hypothetical protein